MNKRKTEIFTSVLGIVSIIVAILSLVADSVSVLGIAKDIWTVITAIFLGALLVSVGIVFVSLLTGKGVLSGWGKILYKKVSEPTDEKQTINSADVIQAIVSARQGKINVDELANIVIESVNSMALNPKLGADILGEFNYSLVLKPDGTFELAKSKKSENIKPVLHIESKEKNLAKLIRDFTNKFELPSSVEKDESGIHIGLPLENKIFQVTYVFNKSDDSYEFATALGKVDSSQVQEISTKLLVSEPIKGITERIDSDGKYIVLGNRDGLKKPTDKEVEGAIMDDLGRIAQALEKFKTLKESGQ